MHALSRGYGGSTRGPHRVTPDDDSGAVGDEALPLAAAAPTWVALPRRLGSRRDRRGGRGFAAGRRTAKSDAREGSGAAGDPRGFGFGNASVSPPARCASRSRARVALSGGGIDRPRSHRRGRHAAGLAPGAARAAGSRPEIAALAGRAVLAFAGIGRQEKFFATLTEAGVEVVATAASPIITATEPPRSSACSPAPRVRTRRRRRPRRTRCGFRRRCAAGSRWWRQPRMGRRRRLGKDFPGRLTGSGATP